jgi:hypothetical protein
LSVFPARSSLWLQGGSLWRRRTAS